MAMFLAPVCTCRNCVSLYCPPPVLLVLFIAMRSLVRRWNWSCDRRCDSWTVTLRSRHCHEDVSWRVPHCTSLGRRADAQTSAAKREQAAETSQSLLPRVHFGLCSGEFLGGRLPFGQGNIFVAARALEHPTAPPATPPADDGGVFSGHASDIDADAPIRVRGDGCRRARPGALKPAPKGSQSSLA